MSNDNQTPKGEEQEKERGLTIKTDFTFNQVEYLISKMVCEFAPQHSQIESPWMFIIRSIKEYPAEFVASPTPVDKKGADDWGKLRDKFFKECTDKEKYPDLIPKVNIAPHDLFEWFKRQFAATAPQQKAAQGKEVEFSEWIRDNRYVWSWDGKRWIAAWNNYSEHTTTELFDLFKSQL